MAQLTELTPLALSGRDHLAFLAKALGADLDSDLISAMRWYVRTNELKYNDVKALDMEALITALGYLPRDVVFRERQRHQMMKLPYVETRRRRYA